MIQNTKSYPRLHLLIISLFFQLHGFSQCDTTLSGINITFPNPSGICLEDGLQTGLSGGFPEGGIYSGLGVIDDGNGSTFRFDPSQTGPGVQSLFYTLSNISIWEQAGQKISGTFVFPGFGEEALPDGTGEALAISADGNTLAIGAKFRSNGNFEGGVEVYDWNGSSWLVRPLVFGDNGFSRFGGLVSLSADGNRLAVSATSGSPSFTRILDWNGTTWIQVGQDIEEASSVIELSSNGNRLMIGRSTPSASGGSIVSYDWDGNNWVPAGQAIEGLGPDQPFGNVASLSGDGTVIAAGIPDNSSFSSPGMVQIYFWNGSDWVLFISTQGPEAGGRFGKSVALSEDGTLLAVGSDIRDSGGSNPGNVTVFGRQGTTYQILGSRLEGLTDGDDFGKAISLSANGSRLVVGSPENNLNGPGSGLIQVFDWDGSQWGLVGGNILGDDPEIIPNTVSDDGLGREVTISADGSRIVGGSDGLSDLDYPILGYVKAYSLVSTSISCVAEAQIEVATCSVACEQVNFALGKPTETPCDYGNSTSDLGVDGITDGNSPWRNPNIVHTCVPFQDPWWQVDLEEEIEVSSICVYNRNSSNTFNVKRLSNYYLFISSQPFDTEASLQEIIADPSIYHTLVEETASFPSCIPIPNITGRYVRIQLEGNKVLNFAELEVLGCKKSSCSTPTNLALNKEASQSSVYGLGVASIALDGDLDGSRGPWRNASIQHTQREEQPWWQVNLGKAAAIKEIQIYNRTDCCVGRLKDFYVFTSLSPINANRSVEELKTDPAISHTYFPGTAGVKEVLNLSDTKGQYLAIKLASSGILHMAEVEVMGCFEEGINSAARFSNVTEEPASTLTRLPDLGASPNPFEDYFNLEIKGELPENTRIELINTVGQVIGSYTPTGQITRIEPVNLPVGIYFLQVSTKEEQRKLKVVKMR